MQIELSRYKMSILAMAILISMTGCGHLWHKTKPIPEKGTSISTPRQVVELDIGSGHSMAVYHQFGIPLPKSYIPTTTRSTIWEISIKLRTPHPGYVATFSWRIEGEDHVDSYHKKNDILIRKLSDYPLTVLIGDTKVNISDDGRAVRILDLAQMPANSSLDIKIYSVFKRMDRPQRDAADQGPEYSVMSDTPLSINYGWEPQ